LNQEAVDSGFKIDRFIWIPRFEQFVCMGSRVVAKTQDLLLEEEKEGYMHTQEAGRRKRGKLKMVGVPHWERWVGTSRQGPSGRGPMNP